MDAGVAQGIINGARLGASLAVDLPQDDDTAPAAQTPQTQDDGAVNLAALNAALAVQKQASISANARRLSWDGQNGDVGAAAQWLAQTGNAIAPATTSARVGPEAPISVPDAVLADNGEQSPGATGADDNPPWDKLALHCSLDAMPDVADDPSLLASNAGGAIGGPQQAQPWAVGSHWVLDRTMADGSKVWGTDDGSGQILLEQASRKSGGLPDIAGYKPGTSSVTSSSGKRFTYYDPVKQDVPDDAAKVATDLGTVSAGGTSPAAPNSATALFPSAGRDTLAGPLVMGAVPPPQTYEQRLATYNALRKDPDADGSMLLQMRKNLMDEEAQRGEKGFWDGLTPAEQRAADNQVEQAKKQEVRWRSLENPGYGGYASLTQWINPNATAAQLDQAGQFGSGLFDLAGARTVPWSSGRGLGTAALPAAEDGEGNAHPNISRNDLGPLLGSGGNKDVYAYGDNQAVGVLRNGKKPDKISGEINMLGQLQEAGIPTVNPRAINVDGKPGMIMDQFAQGSKDVVKYSDGKVRVVGNSALLNQRSIADLQSIRATMVNKKICINDLQFLIGADGRMVVADPLDVDFGTEPSKKNLRMIDLLIQSAQKNGASN